MTSSQRHLMRGACLALLGSTLVAAGLAAQERPPAAGSAGGLDAAAIGEPAAELAPRLEVRTRRAGRGPR